MTFIPIHRDHKRNTARYNEACRLFTAGQMSEAVFGATLFGLGWRGQELRSEINLHEPPRPPALAPQKFVSGLA